MAQPTNQMPPEVREFTEALRAYNLAVAGWLNLNPEQVFSLDVEENDAPEPFRVTWEATERQQPRLGHPGAWGMRNYGDENTIHSGEVLLSWMDAQEMVAVVGEKPRMFTAEEEARLRAIFPAAT